MPAEDGKEGAVNDKRKRCREFLIAPGGAVVDDVLRGVGDDESVAAVVSVLKKRLYPWDMTPVLLGNCEIPGGHHPLPTLKSQAERSAIKDAYFSLSDENQWILCNYAISAGVPAEIETDVRDTFIFQCCSNICHLYGSGSGYKPLRNIAENILAAYPGLRPLHDPEDLVQIALERLHVNFYKIHPTSYRGYLIKTIRSRTRDIALVEGASPIETPPAESDETGAMPVSPKMPPHSRVIIREALDELRAALREYFGDLADVSYRSRYQKVVLLLIYELGDDADVSQAALARLIGASPQSITDWRGEYLAALPTIFKVLTDEVW